MALTLSTYQQRTSPAAVGTPRANFPALVDPTGQALSELASQVQKIGVDMYNVQREADLQDRIGKATAEISELELGLERDPDFRSSPQRFQEQADSIRDKYLDGVSDTAVATAFRKQYQQLSLAKSLNVRRAAWAKEKDYNVASLDDSINTYATAAANAKNPAEAAIVENQARIAIASAQTGMWISAEDAGKRERTFLTKRDSAIVIRDLSIDPGMTATKLSLDPTYAANIDPVARERYVDQAFRRSLEVKKATDAAAEAERKRRGDELYKEAISRQVQGTLTPSYVEEVRAFVEPAEYKSLLAGLSGADRKDDPTVFSTLEALVESNPAEARAQAFVFHRAGLIRNETLASINGRSRTMERQGGPRTEYERSRQFIADTLRPSPLVNDPAGSARYALAVREFDDFAANGQRKDQELRDKADEIQRRFALVDMVELARKTSAGAKGTPEQQLESLQVQGQQLLDQFQAKKIDEPTFRRKMSDLDKAIKAAEKAARANGGK